MKSVALCLLFASMTAKADWVRITDEKTQALTMQRIVNALPSAPVTNCFFHYSHNDTQVYIDLFSAPFTSFQDAMDATQHGKAAQVESREYGTGYMYQDTSTNRIGISGDKHVWETSKAQMTVTFDSQMEKIVRMHFDVDYFENASVDCPLF